MNVPSSSSAPLSTPERIAPAKAPGPPLGGVPGFVRDHSLKPSYESEHVLMPSHEPQNRISSHPKPLTSTAHAPFTLATHGLLGRNGFRSTHGHFFSSDDIALSKQIAATHAPETDDLDVKPILSVIEEILRPGKPMIAEDILGSQVQAHTEAMDEKLLHTSHEPSDRFIRSADNDSEIVRVLPYPINKISCEIICKFTGGGESHSVTMDLLRAISSYSWDAKVVITFAAFAIKNRDQLRLVEHLHTTNPVAKNIATLKDLPDMTAHAVDLKKKFEYVLNLLNLVLKGTHCIVEFTELSCHELPEVAVATSHILTTVYWIIRSILVCASKLPNLIGSGHEYITSIAESWEILGLIHKLSVILVPLQNQLTICRELIERKEAEDAYLALKKLMETPHIDNMKVLGAMIHSRDGIGPLYDGSKRKNERLKVLRLKYVLLLISDLELSQEELTVLHVIYFQHEMRQEYEVLWLPILDPAVSKSGLTDDIFNKLRNNMPWYSVGRPSLVEPVAVRYIREVWKFVHLPMLVVLDPQGKPSNLDALPMMLIWGSVAFPFTKAREISLWAESAWNIELLGDHIHPSFQEWIKEDKVICLYGGEDIEWIRKFTVSARAAAQAVRVPLEMLYVGKSNPKGKVRRCHEVICRENLSHVFSVQDYYNYVWYFWVRLWSMWNSKKQLGMTVKSDRIMQEIMAVLTFNYSEQGWAVFSRGNYEITKGNGDKMLLVFENYNQWVDQVDHPKKFVPVLDEQLRDVHAEHHCTYLILAGIAGYIPEEVHCSDCGKLMDQYVMYCRSTD